MQGEVVRSREQRGRQYVHTLRFPSEATEEDVRSWLAAHEWLGYHPAGYGPVEIKRVPQVGSSLWEYWHYMSCD